jgi:hypothetical protein
MADETPPVGPRHAPVIHHSFPNVYHSGDIYVSYASGNLYVLKEGSNVHVRLPLIKKSVVFLEADYGFWIPELSEMFEYVPF